MRCLAILAAASLTLSGCASRAPAPVRAAPPVAQAPTQFTQSFVQASVSSHLFEMQSAELALQLSRDAGVRAYAQSLYHDHSQLLSRTSVLMESARIHPPSQMLQQQHFNLFNQLQTAVPAQFDETFRNIQVMAHLQAIDLNQRYVTTGDNAILRSLASETLPVLQAHLNAAQSLRLVASPRYKPPPRSGERG